MVDLLALRIEYTPAPPPECPLCGAPMGWMHCVRKHNYIGSRWLVCPRPGCEHTLDVDGYTTGDQRVLDLIAEVERLRKKVPSEGLWPYKVSE